MTLDALERPEVRAFVEWVAEEAALDDAARKARTRRQAGTPPRRCAASGPDGQRRREAQELIHMSGSQA